MYRCKRCFKTRPIPRSKIGVNAGGAHSLQLYHKNKYGESRTVEPQHYEGTGKNLLPIMRPVVLRFFFKYFTIAVVNKIIHYMQDFVI